VGKKRRGGTVEDWTTPVTQHREVVAVRVPGTVWPGRGFIVRTRGPGDLDKARAGLDQPPCEEATLTEARHAVALAQRHRLVIEMKGPHRARSLYERQGLGVIGLKI